MDRDGNGAISLSEYFAIFEDHGITVSKEKQIIGNFSASSNSLLKSIFLLVVNLSGKVSFKCVFP